MACENHRKNALAAVIALHPNSGLTVAGAERIFQQHRRTDKRPDSADQGTRWLCPTCQRYNWNKLSETDLPSCSFCGLYRTWEQLNVERREALRGLRNELPVRQIERLREKGILTSEQSFAVNVLIKDFKRSTGKECDSIDLGPAADDAITVDMRAFDGELQATQLVYLNGITRSAASRF